MKIRDQEGWDKGLANNTDMYGACIYKYAESWADIMEDKMAAGADLPDIAKECSHEADRRPGMGITGYMYGAAVSVLSHCWEHGEALRRWHNLDTQTGNEGEKANREGGTLNPALLVIGTAD